MEKNRTRAALKVIIFLFTTVKLFWNNLYGIKRYINKADLIWLQVICIINLKLWIKMAVLVAINNSSEKQDKTN